MSDGRRPPTKAWGDHSNAVAYDDFARRFPMYRDTAADLVSRLHLSPGAAVLDLCCGTGVSAEVVLGRLGPSGHVIAVDGSEAMLAVGRRQLPDARLRWVHSRAENSDQQVAPDSVDAVVCNSAIWQTEFAATAAAARTVLRSGGRFVFNIGRRFLILPFTADEVAPDRTPDLFEVMQAIAVLDYRVAPVMAGRRGALTPDAVRRELETAGFAFGAMDIVEFRWSHAQDRAWLQVPVFARQVPGRTDAERAAILDAAYQRVQGDPVPVSRWAVFEAVAQ